MLASLLDLAIGFTAGILGKGIGAIGRPPGAKFLIGKPLPGLGAQGSSLAQWRRQRQASRAPTGEGPSPIIRPSMKFQPDTLDGVNNITRYDVDNLA